jgi:hypothetical protein
VEAFTAYGVVSFDSTSPLRKAFKDDRHNYYATNTTYTAVRVPQVDANPELLRRITAGEIKQEQARDLEQRCLRALISYDHALVDLEEVLYCLRQYENLHDGKIDRSKAYRRVLADKPWKACPCEVCTEIGIHVVIFRGAERNRRRGFHNLYVFHKRLLQQLDFAKEATPLSGSVVHK